MSQFVNKVVGQSPPRRRHSNKHEKQGKGVHQEDILGEASYTMGTASAKAWGRSMPGMLQKYQKPVRLKQGTGAGKEDRKDASKATVRNNREPFCGDPPDNCNRTELAPSATCPYSKHPL